MATVNSKIKIEFSATLTLNETEMRALDAIIGYGYEGFITTFKKYMGESYIRGHESGAESLFKAIGRDVGPALRQVDDARAALSKAPA